MKLFTLFKNNPLSSLMMIVSIISLSLPVFAAPLPGAFIGSTITVGDTANTYAIADVNYLQGGLHSYTTLSQRNAITLERRHWGMLAAVTNDGGNNGTYQLTYNAVDTDITNNANWTLFSAGGGGGSITLQTDGTPNGSQTLLNLVGGSNVTLTDDGSGTVTIDASGGGGGGSQWDDVAGGINYDGNVGIGDATLESGTQLTIGTGTNEIGILINPTDTLLRGISVSNLSGSISAVIGGFEDQAGIIAQGAVGVFGISNSPTGSAVYASQSDDAGHGIYSSAAQNYFSGNVGVGTAAPQYKVHVAVSEYGGIALQNTTEPLQDPSLVSFTMLNWQGDPTLTISGRSGDDSFENGGTVYADIGTLRVGADEDIVIASNTGEIVMLNQTLALTGALRYVDGNEAANSILIGDASGNATWGLAPISIVNSNSLFSTGLTNAGVNSTAVFSNFFGESAGANAINAGHSNFFGYEAGSGATNAQNSNFFGESAGSGAIDALASNFFGANAGLSATDANNSNFIGNAAGSSASGANNSNFFGQNAGFNAINARNSNFIGSSSGLGAAGARNSNFIGISAGSGATDALNSNFFGVGTGQSAVDANNSNFIGSLAGSFAETANNSNFIGTLAGFRATNAAFSTFIGYRAGGAQDPIFPIEDGALNAANSIFIGTDAGYEDLVDNTTDADDFSILLGNHTSTGGFSNSIALGAYAANTASNEFMIGSTTRPIDSTVIIGTAGTSCTITTGTSMSCSSDERLKTNIEDLSSDTLEKLLSVKTVSYNWISRPDASPMVGFLAQDLQTYFPELVTVGPEEYLQVNYAGMTPILVEAIREINTRITTLSDIDTDNSWRDSLTDWFASAQNGIGKLFAREITTKTLCVEDEDGDKTCISKDQLDALLYSAGTSGASSSPDPVEETPETQEEVDGEETPAPEEESTEPVEPAEEVADEAPVETQAPEAEPEVQEPETAPSEEPATP